MEDIKDFTVLIGENSSGKSNLLEALYLFFSEFDPAPEHQIGPINDYVWFDRNIEKPIDFHLGFKVSETLLVKILPYELEQLKNTGSENLLEIHRQISGSPDAAFWSTESVKLNQKNLIENRQLVYDIKKDSTEPEAITKTENESIKPHPQTSATEPKKSDSTKKPPKKSKTDIQEKLLQNLTSNIQANFKMIFAARNSSVPTTAFGDRSSLIQSSIVEELTKSGQSMKREHQQKWRDLEEQYTSASPSIRDIRIAEGQVIVHEKRSSIPYPIQLVGGGNQEVLTMMYELGKSKEAICGIEEPEQHLHPELARNFFDYLKEISKMKQIFITTHSPIFVDQTELENTWIVRKESNESKFVRVKEIENLKNILYEIGTRPSDIFFSNSILFVEGETERRALPILSKKIGIDFKDIGLSVISIRGKGSGKYHLKIWTEASNSANVPYFMILDKDAEDEANKLISNGVLKKGSNLFILDKGSIEDYYPIKRIVDVLKSEYDLEINDKDKKELSKSPRVNCIKKILEENDKISEGWKVIIGQKIASTMIANEIDEEIVRIFERLKTKSG